MRKRSRHNGRLEGLRLAIDCLPVATREAMLEAVLAGGRIIAGAYVDNSGGVCPMLAAHRRGARTDQLSFARAWDRFTGVGKTPRVASERELAILVSQLRDSLEAADGTELDAAIAEHRGLRAERMRRRRRALAGADPRGEIRARRLRPPSGDDGRGSHARRAAVPV